MTEFEDVIDFESLPDSTLSTHLAAGALAGMLEHCAVYPIDSIKTKMQTLNPQGISKYRSLVSAVRTTFQTKGMMSTYRGINVVAIGAGPAHALYFAAYEGMKNNLKPITGFGDTHISVAGLSGIAATLLHDGFMNPFDVVKQRLQMVDSPYKNVRHCVQSIIEKEGLRGFYRSYSTQITMNIPFQSIHFFTYENLSHRLNPQRKYDPVAHVIAGAGAGAFAAGITTPLDVIKTTLNTQESVTTAHTSNHYIRGMKEAAQTIYKTRGLVGFSSGIQARILFYIPSTAICWSVYEFFKYTITKSRIDNNSSSSTSNSSSSSSSSLSSSSSSSSSFSTSPSTI